MDRAGIEALREAIRRKLGCEGMFVSSELVACAGWRGEVTTFDLVGHTSGAGRCWAWTCDAAPTGTRFHAVRATRDVTSAAAAVAFAIR
jgi:hypothetical protein